jgi:hypothetical protein
MRLLAPSQPVNQTRGFLREFGINRPISQTVINHLASALVEHVLLSRLVSIREHLRTPSCIWAKRSGSDKEVAHQLAEHVPGSAYRRSLASVRSSQVHSPPRLATANPTTAPPH